MKGKLLLALLFASNVKALDLGEPPAFPEVDIERAKLGQLLFYDAILSGNKNISCATCHHPKFGTTDGVSLAIGEGGHGLGPERRADTANYPEQRIARNAPGLWNLGASEFTVMFHDGRLEAHKEHPQGIRTPLGKDMADGFDSVLAAQAMFPVLSSDEMAGHANENAISKLVRQGKLSVTGGAWEKIAARVAAIPAYRTGFTKIGEKHITFAVIANVVADFIRHEWRADNSPFDRYLRDGEALPAAAMRGLNLFYGKAGCAQCHSGWLQTDHQFHAIAMPQIGPGKAARFETHARDEGRMRVTGKLKDAYAFRTPSLRNITLTAPYGHSGAYNSLEDVIRHHLEPVHSLYAYRLSQAILPELVGVNDSRILADPEEMTRIATANELAANPLHDSQIADLIAFLQTLENNVERLGVPEQVPSALAVEH